MIKRLFSDSVIYGLSGIMSRLFGFLLLPLYSKILLPADYGVLGLYNTTFFLLSVVLVFGMDSATFRFYYDTEEAAVKKGTTATWLWLQWTLSALLIAISFLFSKPLGQLIFGLPEAADILKCLCVVLFLHALPNIQEVWFRIARKPWSAFSFAMLITIINISVTYYFIVIARDGYWGFIKGQLVSYGAGTVISLFLLRSSISPRYFNGDLLRRMLRYGAPLVPAIFFTLSIPWLCNYFLKSKVNYNELGLYNMANTFASILTLVTGSFAQAFAPFAFSIIGKNNARETFARVFLIYVAGLSLLCLGYGLFSQEALAVATRPIYSGAWLVMILLSYHYFFISTASIGVLGTSIEKKSSPYAIAVLAATITSVILLLVFIPLFGKEGAAIALLTGQLLIPIMTFRTSQKFYPIPFAFGSAVALIGCSVLTIFLVHLLWPVLGLSHGELALGLLLKVILFLSYCLLTFFFLKKKGLLSLAQT
ncbi:MAG TPA: oligosaccharide flippase family protein [Flavisolibacter sp.]|jgi:O-antigen/teichoic acid export membrane protein|nr:oligosaccharide flippase family protein [Flavisolibacter sp.]